jgi:PAS domain S-box-containing protein
MNHHDDKTKAQLINELDGMRQRVEALESLAIKGRLTEAALATHKNQVDALRMVTAEITRELNVETLLRLITQRAVDLVEAATSGAVYLWDEANEVMIPQAWHGRGEWMREIHIGIGEGLVGTVAQRRQGVLVNDYPNSPHVNRTFLERLGFTAIVVEPLLYRDRLVGIILISNEGTGRSFTAQDHELLKVFATQAAIAIENAQLFEQAQDQRTQLESRNTQLRREVAERQRVEEALRESEAQYRILVEGSIQGISVVDRQGIRLFANPAYAHIFGYRDPQDVIGQPILKNIAPHERDRISRHRHARFRGELAPTRFDYQGVRQDGTLIWLESMSTLVSWAGAPAQLVALVDITERKRAEQERLQIEQQMQQAQKLESLGVLAGGIAHDFNNLLTGILTNAGMARQALAPHHPATSYVGEAIQGARLASHLAGQLLAYAGKGRFHIRPLDLSAEVRELQPLLTTAVRGQGRLVFDLAPSLPSIEADPAQLHQVLMNLVLNAAECVAEEVTIRITTDSRALVSDELGHLVPGHHLSAGDCVVLQVQDTGCGMDEATLQRIFDPFFTSKATGRGLGLAATLGIVHGHGGGLRLTSRVGTGTTFELYFPASDKPVDQVAEDDPRDLSGQGVILVVDDDVFVLKAASAALQRLGYRVLLAEDGDRALEVFQERLQEIDLIVLDMTMPGMSGDETFRRLRALHPEVKVLLSSAYDEEEVAGQITPTAAAGFLPKPYDPQQLGSQVKRLLEGAGAAMPAMTAPDPELSAVQVLFRQRLPARLEALAVALREAQANSGSHETLQAAHGIAHMLKGTVGSYGFDELATVLEGIETTLKEGRDGKRRWTEMDWTRLRDTVDQARAALERETPSD